MDTDPALEIITGSGYVFDGISGNNEWYFSPEFGRTLAVGDFDGNGVDEIIGGTRLSNPVIYSAILKSELWQINNTDVCTINTANIDEDPQDEILIGNCQNREIHIYDGSTGSATEQYTFSTIQHSSISLTTGDVDSDSDLELIWASGIGSSGEDILAVAELGDEPAIAWYNQDPAQLDSFVAAGWASSSSLEDQAIFIVPETDSDYGGQRIVQMNELEDIRVSEEINHSWELADQGVITDYNNDGVQELFLSTAYLYDSAFIVLDLDSYDVIWGDKKAGDDEDNITTVIAGDVNGDGFSDSVIVNSDRIQAIDIQNQVSLWLSTRFSGIIHDVAIHDLDNDDTVEFIVATEEGLTTWKKSRRSYTRTASVTQNCNRIEVGELIDGKTNIICIDAGGYTRDQSHIIIFNNQLIEENRNSVDDIITDFIFEDTSASKKNLIIALHHNPRYNYQANRTSTIQSIDPFTGKTIWVSPKLLGNVPRHSLYYAPTSNGKKRLTFATNDAMYMTR
ncbi:MAG: hypothetical protein KUG82_09750 [Pseudomonadales bacterium]|nr:hypothetical protein [Pseudomonadales bacterium]